MLRESAKAINTQVDLKAITDDTAGDGNIPHGGTLTAFAEAVLGDDEVRLDTARRRVRAAVNDAGFVDAAAVIANYSALDRVADATGIPLEAAKEANTVELRTELDIDDFA